MVKSGFYRFGQKAGRKFLKAKWVWESVSGGETDAIKTEYRIGLDMALAIREQASCVTDIEIHDYLEGIGQRLERSVKKKHYQFHVTIIIEDHPTAFAIPGGFIFVAQSLVNLCDKDKDEIAFVIGHEMAHVIRRHAIKRLLRKTALSAASLVSPGRNWFAPWIKKVGLQWLELAYSQDEEFEADALGVLLMRAAGFNPLGSIRLLERFRGSSLTSDDSVLGPYFSTHPSVEDRILKLHEYLDDLLTESKTE